VAGVHEEGNEVIGPAPALLLFAAYGLAWVLGRSKLTLALREWLAAPRDAPADRYHSHMVFPPRPAALWVLALIECPGCVGFHEGWVYGAVTRAGWRASILFGLGTLAMNLIFETIVSHIKE
jgi:hypothetical protein